MSVEGRKLIISAADEHEREQWLGYIKAAIRAITKDQADADEAHKSVDSSHSDAGTWLKFTPDADGIPRANFTKGPSDQLIEVTVRVVAGADLPARDLVHFVIAVSTLTLFVSAERLLGPVLHPQVWQHHKADKDGAPEPLAHFRRAVHAHKHNQPAVAPHPRGLGRGAFLVLFKRIRSETFFLSMRRTAFQSRTSSAPRLSTSRRSRATCPRKAVSNSYVFYSRSTLVTNHCQTKIGRTQGPSQAGASLPWLRFFGAHGQAKPEHLERGHQEFPLFDEGLRLPLPNAVLASLGILVISEQPC